MKRYGLDDSRRRTGCAPWAALALTAALAAGCSQNPKAEPDPAANYRRTTYTPDYARLYDDPSVYQNADDPKAAEEYRKMLQDLSRINQQLQVNDKPAK